MIACAIRPMMSHHIPRSLCKKDNNFSIKLLAELVDVGAVRPPIPNAKTAERAETAKRAKTAERTKRTKRTHINDAAE